MDELKYVSANIYLSKDKIKGENFDERMSRFGLIVENANGNWDLSDRDENAIRTANSLLIFQKYKILSLEARIGRLREAIDNFEGLQYIDPNMREAAYNKAVLDCTNRMLEAMKEDGNELP